MIGTGELRIKRKVPRAVWTAVKSYDHIRSASRNILIDRLANPRLELGQVAWQIDHDVALLPIDGIQFDTELGTAVIGLGPAISGHASHSRSASRKSAQIQIETAQSCCLQLRYGGMSGPPHDVFVTQPFSPFNSETSARTSTRTN